MIDFQYLYELRKRLHRVPELAFKEFLTQDIVMSELDIYVGDSLQLHTFSPTGLLYEYAHGEGDYILFRADMDALPVVETTDCDFRSQHEGLCHACGHDVHITILVGLIKYVVSSELRLNILFLFQPAEEGYGGAQHIIKTGIFDKYSIKSAFALHVSAQFPTGTIGIKSGIIFGIPQEFDVEISGVAGHVATPQKGRDSFLAGVSFIQEVNALIAKRFPAQEPVIFHIGKITAGTVRNIIPQHCKLEGTTRCLKKEVRQEINEILFNVASSIEQMHDVKVKVTLLSSYDPVVNDSDLVNRLQQNIPPDINVEVVECSMTGEDFGFFSSLYPTVLFWLGCRNSDSKILPVPDLHASNFLPDEKCIISALNIYKSILDNQI